jgi:putative endonuclease
MLYSVTTGHLYTGIALDSERRLDEHNGKNKKGAKATRRGRPWRIVRVETHETKSLALKRELVIKKMTRAQKLLLCGLSA